MPALWLRAAPGGPRSDSSRPSRRSALAPETIAIVLASALLHATWSAMMKRSPNTLAFNVLQLLPTLAVTALLLPRVVLAEVPADLWWVLALSGAIHGLYFGWLTRAIETADLSLVYPIVRSTPALVALVAGPLLGERLSAAGALGIATVVGGVWLVQSGGSLRWRRLLGPGVGYAYLALATTVGYSLADKRAMGLLEAAAWTSHVPRAVFFYFVLASASVVTFAPFAFRRIGRRELARSLRLEWRAVLIATGVSFASYALILDALRSAEVSYVVAVRQTSVLFALMLGAVWLRERPDRPRVVGAAATVAGVALIALGV